MARVKEVVGFGKVAYAIRKHRLNRLAERVQESHWSVCGRVGVVGFADFFQDYGLCNLPLGWEATGVEERVCDSYNAQG